MLHSAARRLADAFQPRTAKRAARAVESVLRLEKATAALDDAALAARTGLLRTRLAAGETMDSLLPEAFAAAREASARVLGLRHYGVQIFGGAVLHQGRIAEMKTGEGKTLAAVLPAYLNALPGKGVHIVTANDYLARRDADEMGRVFGFLGMTVGCIVPDMPDDDRRAAYAADITYATNAEIGFDYLRDHIKMSRREMVQRPFSFAIVDEVDSILIDEARVPLIISVPGPDSSAAVAVAQEAVSRLSAGDWETDLKARSSFLTERGLLRVEAWLREYGAMSEAGHLHDHDHLGMVAFIHQALKARTLFERDRDYIVRDGKVLLVDAHTGRTMDGRRFSDGLHQALEAKEGVEILPENVTAAAVSYQNLFRMYPRLSGMTGTAATEADEFAEIYGLEVVRVPTHRPVARVDHDDEIYLTSEARDQAVARLVRSAQAKGQPVLVGTSSVERSETLSGVFEQHGIPHSVLNARQHEREAFIVAQAGRPGAVTIATNMAGRGTDIKLGGNPEMLADEAASDAADHDARSRLVEFYTAAAARDAAKVREAGGLLVVGTERHESRRVDDQLRGRSGRQGDPGESRFLVSMQDELMRRFGGDRMARVLSGLGLEPGEPISHRVVSRSVKKAQERVEWENFEARKNLLKYDDVANQQRQVYYAQRMALIDGEDVGETMAALRETAVSRMVDAAMPKEAFPEQWNADGLAAAIGDIFAMSLPVRDWMNEEGVDAAAMKDRILAEVERSRAEFAASVPADALASLERDLMLQAMDMSWQELLTDLEIVREGIGLRSYGQKNPLYEWQSEAARMFQEMLDRASKRALAALSRIRLVEAGPGRDVSGGEGKSEGEPSVVSEVQEE